MDDLNRTFIQAVLDGRNVEKIQELINRGADVHADDDYAVRIASENGYTEVVRLLLSRGADIHAKDNLALILAAHYGRFDVVKLLLENGANVHADNDDYALKLASENGHTEVVKLLLANDAAVHAGDDYAVRWASQKGHTEVVRLLLSRGANIHAKGNRALILAARDGRFDVVKLLLENGAGNRNKALGTALDEGHKDAAELLLSWNDNKFQDYREDAEDYKHRDLLGRYRINGLGQTGLIFAVLNNDLGTVERILRTLPADNYINNRDDFGKSALDYAVRFCKEDMMQLLLAAGARASSMTLVCAVLSKQFSMVEKVVALGVKISPSVLKIAGESLDHQSAIFVH